MKRILLNFGLAGMAALMLTVSGCSKDDDDNGNSGPGNVLAVAKADAELTLFAEAAEKAGLGGVLAGGGQITVFAPTNNVLESYLADLNVSDIDALIQLRGEAAVRQLLSYHVMDGKMEAADIVQGYQKTRASNAQGDALDLYINTVGSVTFNGSSAIVTETNIDAANGVIHKIGGVLEPQTIEGLLSANSAFTTFAEASFKASGDVLGELGNTQSTYTVMAPNNGAFGAFFAENSTVNNIDDVIGAFGTQGLEDILKYHIIVGYKRTDNLSGDQTTLLNGEVQTVSKSGSNIIITDGAGRQVNVVFRDVTAINGNINIIDNVLLDD